MGNPDPKSILQVCDISVRFGGLQALAEVSFGVNQGEILGVVGPNGAGKSTLFGVICGDVHADSGTVLLGQQPLTRKSSHEIARLGLVRTFQTPRPFTSMTFLENVTIAALARTNDVSVARARGEGALSRVGLLDCGDRPSSGASTGQRKRLDIARALATEPTVLLLDEPLGGVDPGSIAEVIALLGRMRSEGMTLVVIEHNLEALTGIADRLIAMTLGRKIAEGLPGEVMRDERLVRAYLGEDDHVAA
jgi:branched-chain amino acid transport system ATP-binding protein